MLPIAGVAWASIWSYFVHAWDVTGTSPIAINENSEIVIGHTYAIVVSQDCQINYTDENKNKYQFDLLANVPGMEANEVVWQITDPYIEPPWWERYRVLLIIGAAILILLIIILLSRRE